MIRACWLFGVRMDAVTVTVHPQSIVHSMVEFSDRSVKAQLSLPDAVWPLLLTLSWPGTHGHPPRPLPADSAMRLDFLPPDEARFPALSVARHAMEKPGVPPAS